MKEDRQIDFDSFNILFLPELLEALPPDMLPYVEDIRQQIREIQKEEEIENDILFSVVGSAAVSECYEKQSVRKKKYASRQPSFLDAMFTNDEAPTLEKEPDVRTQAILDAWENIERIFGITIDDLYVILRYRVKLSRLTITTTNNIFLSDYDNKEVKLDNLTKALYFFYLRHRDGASLKELQEHEDEILKYYLGITGRDDLNKIRTSVKALLDPYANNLNVSLSRIKKAFREAAGDKAAPFYYIDGPAGRTRKVHLDSDLIIWEH